MLILRKDGTLVYYPVERAVTLNPEVITSDYTLPNGNVIRMECHYGEKVLVVDQDALAAARKAEGLDEGPPSPKGEHKSPWQRILTWWRA